MAVTNISSLETIQSSVSPNTLVNIHVICIDLCPPNSQKVSQTGQLKDANGDQIKFMSYDRSNTPDLEAKSSYFLQNAMAISDDVQGRAILLTADTTIEDADDPIGGIAPNENPCPECKKTMPSNAYHEDGLAPEMGWKYWHCPHCDEKFRPETINS